jgi:hypothetical protein
MIVVAINSQDRVVTNSYTSLVLQLPLPNQERDKNSNYNRYQFDSSAIGRDQQKKACLFNASSLP